MTDKLTRATHGSSDQPLRIGDIEIPCYVLEDGKRVIVRQAVITGLGMSQGAASRVLDKSLDRLTKFIEGKRIKPFISSELSERIKTPVRFRTTSGTPAYGFEATVLADLCDAVLAARREKQLHPQQYHIAAQCEILVRGFARIGIIALVDEATGYQEIRDRTALQAILDKFLRKELAAWAKRFPDEFYREMFRLKGWTWQQLGGKKPPVVGRYTADLVYDRLAPDLLESLQEKNPKDERGNRKAKHHQWLTEDVGHPALAQHLYAVIGLMRASSNWDQFYRMMQRAYPKMNTNMLLPIGDQE